MHKTRPVLCNDQPDRQPCSASQEHVSEVQRLVSEMGRWILSDPGDWIDVHSYDMLQIMNCYNNVTYNLHVPRR